MNHAVYSSSTSIEESVHDGQCNNFRLIHVLISDREARGGAPEQVAGRREGGAAAAAAGGALQGAARLRAGAARLRAAPLRQAALGDRPQLPAELGPARRGEGGLRDAEEAPRGRAGGAQAAGE